MATRMRNSAVPLLVVGLVIGFAAPGNAIVVTAPASTTLNYSATVTQLVNTPNPAPMFVGEGLTGTIVFSQAPTSGQYALAAKAGSTATNAVFDYSGSTLLTHAINFTASSVVNGVLLRDQNVLTPTSDDHYTITLSGSAGSTETFQIVASSINPSLSKGFQNPAFTLTLTDTTGSMWSGDARNALATLTASKFQHVSVGRLIWDPMTPSGPFEFGSQITQLGSLDPGGTFSNALNPTVPEPGTFVLSIVGVAITGLTVGLSRRKRMARS